MEKKTDPMSSWVPKFLGVSSKFRTVCGWEDVWLVVSTHLKHICQNGNLPQIGMKITNIVKPPLRCAFHVGIRDVFRRYLQVYRCVIFFQTHVLGGVGFSMLAKDGPTVEPAQIKSISWQGNSYHTSF